jgi:hypothetical protein
MDHGGFPWTPGQLHHERGDPRLGFTPQSLPQSRWAYGLSARSVNWRPSARPPPDYYTFGVYFRFCLSLPRAASEAQLFDRAESPIHQTDIVVKLAATMAAHHATWLGESGASPDKAKACRKTVEGINWKMSKGERAASKSRRAKPTVSDPKGLL